MEHRTSVALGSFDGLHRGHRNVLQNALSSADGGLLPYVLLFDVHPQTILCGETPPLLLSTEHRDDLLRQMGFSMHTVSFAAIHDMEPEQFVREILCDAMHAGAVSCGYNYRFGKNGSGDAALLKALCAPWGIRVCVSEPVRFAGKPISSTRIRRAVESGEIADANAMLGRAFSYTATVLHGNARGRELGFPTINQKLPRGLVVPKFGVYASEVCVDGKMYRGITNIGVRPTIPDTAVISETNILDFSGDLYGETLTVSLTRFIRPERKFTDLEAVFAQVRKDIKTAYGQ